MAAPREMIGPCSSVSSFASANIDTLIELIHSVLESIDNKDPAAHIQNRVSDIENFLNQYPNKIGLYPLPDRVLTDLSEDGKALASSIMVAKGNMKWLKDLIDMLLPFFADQKMRGFIKDLRKDFAADGRENRIFIVNFCQHVENKLNVKYYSAVLAQGMRSRGSRFFTLPLVLAAKIASTFSKTNAEKEATSIIRRENSKLR